MSADRQNNTKSKIAKFISEQGPVTKGEIAAALKISMPTTLQHVNDLVRRGIVVESGLLESTGGRKAKVLSISSEIGFALGADCTANHLTLVLVDMARQIRCRRRMRLPCRLSYSYYQELSEILEDFLQEAGIPHQKILGLGISLPGIVNPKEKLLVLSHVLKTSQVSLRGLEHVLGFPYRVENDANSAAYAELKGMTKNTVYLALSNTVGGAVCLHGRLHSGENFRGGEFGHMIIQKGGRPCYCGRKGCVDTYCSARLLQQLGGDSLEEFFVKLRQGDQGCSDAWEEYLDYLAITVTNLRVSFDCDVVLGGYVGGYLEEFRGQLDRKVMEYNLFDLDTSYLKTGRYKLEAAAYGAALPFVDGFLEII